MSKFTEYLEAVSETPKRKETKNSIIKKINIELKKSNDDMVVEAISRDGIEIKIENGGHYFDLFGDLSITEIKETLKTNKNDKNIEFNIGFYEPEGDEGADGTYSFKLSRNLLLKIIEVTKVKSFL